MQNIVDIVKNNRTNALKGITECISWKNTLPKLSQRIPGILRNCIYTVTAASGIGKTQFTKYAFVVIPLLQALDNNEKVQIHYYALEESIEEFKCSILSHLLYLKHKIEIAPIDLIGKYTLPLSKEVIEKVGTMKDIMNQVDKYVEVIDHLFSPVEIENDLFKKSLKTGTHFYKKNKKIIPYEEFIELEHHEKEDWIHHSFKQHDDTHHIVVVDHLSILEECPHPKTKEYLSLHKTMKYWSFDVGRKLLSKKMNYTVVNVQQQSATGEDAQHKKLKMLEPSLANLADNKLCGRDSLIILGIFNPHRHGVKNYGLHNIAELKDNFRGVIVLKNRKGISSGKIGTLFNGAVNEFKEL